MFRIKLFIFGLLGAALFLTSCGEDDILGGGGVNEDAPTVSFNSDVDLIDFDSDLEPNTTFRVQVSFGSGASDLSAIRVYRDANLLVGQTTDYDNLDTDIDNNPESIVADADKISVTYTYEFTTSSDIGTYNYEFEVEDAAGLKTSNSINITVTEPLEVINPTFTVASNTTVEAPAGTILAFNTSAAKGTYDIASISVWEDGEPITDLTRIRFAGVDFEFNPLPLFSPESEGFDEQVIIRTIAGTHDYVIRVTDTEDNFTDAAFTIVEQMNTTPLQNTFQFVLFSNASGPNVGGLDLDNGTAVSSASADAEIRDLGIDINLPNSSNWLQQVEPVNGSELRIVNLSGLPDGFTFEGVTSKEQVADAFNSGAVTNPSPALQVGDLLAVSSPTNLYILKVEEIVVTDNNNEDYYSFSIKY